VNPETVVARLEQADVLEPGPDDSFRISEHFEEILSEQAAELANGDGSSAETEIADLGLDSDRANALARLAEIDETAIATYRALAEVTTDLEPDEIFDVLSVFELLQHEAERTEGAPATFFPIEGSHLETFLSLYRKAIIYVWREDCHPCDLMQGDLDDVFGETTDLMTLAVYGPNIPEDVRDQFRLVGAPMTLFVLDGRIDSRLVGAHHAEVIEAEADQLRELAD
jgi:hypothetical protein